LLELITSVIRKSAIAGDEMAATTTKAEVTFRFNMRAPGKGETGKRSMS
jgi:hypothetical protein